MRRDRVWLFAALFACAVLLVSAVPARAQTVTTTVSVGSTPVAVVVNPATNKIYVVNGNSSNVTVIDGATNSTATVSVGSVPGAAAVNPVTNKMYVVNFGSNKVTVIDGATNATTTVGVGMQPQAVAVNPVTNKIYVADTGSSNVTVIDGATNSTTTVSVGSTPYAAAVNPVTNKIYVANRGSNNVTVIDGATNTTSTVSVGMQPQAVAVNAVTNKIYVANNGDDNGTLTVTDDNLGTNGTLQTVSLTGTGAAVTTVSLSPTSVSFGGQAVATNSAAKTVTVKNSGKGQLTFSNTTITGTDPGDFAQATNTCTGSIAPGKTCTISITFTPTATGSRSAKLELTDDAQGTPQTVTLSGSGELQATVSPTSFTFAAETVGTTSAAKIVTLTNNLSTALPISITFTGADPGDFGPTDTCNGSVPAKSHCTISVTFTAKATGTRTATLNVSDSANNSPQTVSLTGTGK